MPSHTGPLTAQPPRPPPRDHPGFVRRSVAERATNAHPTRSPPSDGQTRCTPRDAPVPEDGNRCTWLIPQTVPPCRPLTSDVAVKWYSSYLDEYERVEVFSHRHVYFLGSPAVKVKGSILDPTHNHGYDDAEGDYIITPHDHLAYRYEVLDLLGSGAFGQVVKVHDYKTNQLLACKIIRNRRRYHNQAMMEVRILNLLMQQAADQHVHVVRMVRHFTFRRHLCIVFEMLGPSLYEHIQANDFHPLPLPLIRRFAVQMLLALKHLHDQHIIHADLKPENILLANPTTSSIKIIDFGSSCFVAERAHTYLQSRFYRAPEIILGVSYGCPIDIWSFGCILAELYTGRPLLAGEDEAEQLSLMMAMLGPPPPCIVDQSARRVFYFDPLYSPLPTPNSRGDVHLPASTSLAETVGCPDGAFLSLLSGCLQWDPRFRLTAEQALRQEWIVQGATLPTVKTPTPGPRPPRESPNPHPQRQHHRQIGQTPPPPSRHPSFREGTWAEVRQAAVCSVNHRSDVRREVPSSRQGTSESEVGLLQCREGGTVDIFTQLPIIQVQEAG